MLEWVGAQIGLKVVLTPKCHPELAGEGIEYIWGMTKSNYRSTPLCDKGGKKFETAVEASHSRDFMTIGRMRAAARKARSFIMGYMIINAQRVQDEEGNPVSIQEIILNNDPADLVKIHEMKTRYNSHRNALDFAGGFVKILGSMKS